MSCFYLFFLFISVLYVYLHLFYEFQTLKLEKFWKKTILDFKIRINLENSNNSFWKTKSGPGVKVEKNRARKESHRAEKVKLGYVLGVALKTLINCSKTPQTSENISTD